MAIYTTLFVAGDDELTAFFPGWRLPLDKPLRVERKNPFTGESITAETWDPGPRPATPPARSLFESAGRGLMAPVLPPENDYQRWLEENTPSLLRTLPHCAMKGITGFELGVLAKSLLGKRLPPARFVDCREGEGTIDALPDAAIHPLAELTDSHLSMAATAWREMWEDDRDSDGPVWALLRIRALAQEAVRRYGRIYSHRRV